MTPGSQSIVWSQIDSPIGPLTLVASHHGLCHIMFSRKNSPTRGLQMWLNNWFPNPRLERNDHELQPYIIQLEEYFRRERREFDLPIDLYGTPFQKLVWRYLRTIPYGEVRSYKEVAQGIGAPKAVRAVGGANNKNPVSIVIPCHRVIGSNGSLVGYGGGLHIKEYLLTLEGWLKPNERD
ncbi:[Fe-S]-binding protein [Laceyella sacchari]|jgi:methylated-DNA-[protein]-cysteine S-methyltransferase|uniref:Methylated-DNA--protein-cysteine methyltransferase n=2 Tax=Laceyella TaxID=292635 RepID=A0AA45WIX1_9BACL|nr:MULTISPECIES: methylated-DNA--[protein]-cysteine S-methyltransferase [Laceyella]AUS07996.1 [Fe-S]-binding protein [Laceyella sacchari]MRG27437.1 methylated-DNA--[protein]-cysteine S-methyltransferase [Laceyella tengchongensis]PRZ13836.1 methylated-DNA-[protein]-cysteine S-methyltransferase [Laceyella sediminis]TCW40575.1 methylated-DNA-[protein]-cysteine S-methyltransferase [Laceyella sacchari]SMP01374.1 methylated-DNA-[protein]-cysteine S-methyltransferase [Laceyella tengchongensis]